MRIIKLLKLKFDRFDARYLLRSNNLSDVDNSNDSLNAILPTQTGNSGKALTTDGTDTSWASAGVSDHGALTGLSDDDHTQYVLKSGSLTQITTRSHTALTDIGTNTHAQIDTALGTTIPATYLKLDASNDPVTGTLTATKNIDVTNQQAEGTTGENPTKITTGGPNTKGLVIKQTSYIAEDESNSLMSGLVAYYSLADGVDATGRGNDLTNVGASFVAGKVGNCADLESTESDYLYRADSADLSMGDIDFTVAAWVKMESKAGAGQVNVIATKWSDTVTGGEYYLTYGGTADRFRFGVSPASATPVTQVIDAVAGSPSLGAWYFVVGYHDAANNLLGIVVNAGVGTTLGYATGVYDGTGSLALGRLGNIGLYFWDGLIDEVGIWKRVLTADEITALYNEGNGLSFAEISSWYKAPSGVACVAAYDATGASSLADSYINEANPGTYNAAPGVAPTWAAGTGWTFDGAAQWLTSGVSPASGYSMMVRYAGYSGTGYIVGTEAAGASGFFSISPERTAGKVRYIYGSSILDVAPAAASGVLCIAGGTAYRNGVSDGAIGAWVGAGIPFYIGARNFQGTQNAFAACNIAALAIYSGTLTADDVATISTNMNAL